MNQNDLRLEILKYLEKKQSCGLKKNWRYCSVYRK